MLAKTRKAKVIAGSALHKKDTGSASVQAGLLTDRINKLSDHLKKNKKDKHSRRGLLKMVVKRRKMLDYLKHTNEKAYSKLIKELKIKHK